MRGFRVRARGANNLERKRKETNGRLLDNGGFNMFEQGGGPTLAGIPILHPFDLSVPAGMMSGCSLQDLIAF